MNHRGRKGFWRQLAALTAAAASGRPAFDPRIIAPPPPPHTHPVRARGADNELAARVEGASASFLSPIRLRRLASLGRGAQAARMLLAVAMLPALGHAQNAGVSVPLMLAPDSERQGFVRIINESNQAGSVRITAYDDAGTAASPSSEIRLEAGSVLHFNSDDLADGNASKGISRIGEPSQGHWRLSVETALQDVQVLAFVRTRDGFLTAMHDTLPRNDDGQLVAKMLNPGSNRNQESKLRLVNTGANRESVSIRGVDDQGESAGPVRLTLNAGQSRTLSAYDLENGASGLTGTLGDGAGKWRLLVEAGQSVVGMGLLETSIGPITNTSTTGVPAMAMTQTPGAQDDHGNGFNDATNLAVDGRQSGRIEPAGESDYFRVRVTESGTLTVYTTGELDTRGYLYDSNERQLATNDDGSSSDEGNFRIEREVDAGTYYVRVRAFSSSRTGDYTVHAEFDASTETPIGGDVEYGAYAVGNPIFRRSRDCDVCWTIIHSFGNAVWPPSDTQAEADSKAVTDCNDTVWPLHDGPANCSVSLRLQTGQCLVYAYEQQRSENGGDYYYFHEAEVVPEETADRRRRELDARCQAALGKSWCTDNSWCLD